MKILICFRLLVCAMCLTLSATAKADQPLFQGIVQDVSEDAVVTMVGGARFVFWGLELMTGPALDDLLIGKWIKCRELELRGDLTLADCRVSETSTIPRTSTAYLDLFTWLPKFGLAEVTCNGDANFTFHERWVGEISYGCRSNEPGRGTALQQPIPTGEFEIEEIPDFSELLSILDDLKETKESD